MSGITTFGKTAIALLMLMQMIACAKPKPHAHLVAPPECVTVIGDVQLTDDGKQVLPKSHFPMRISCTKVAAK